MKKLIRSCFILLGLVFAVGFINAQSGSLTGTVHDSTGAAIPNATVTAHNNATGVDITRTTNGAGLYVLTLSPGTYRLSGSAEGFQSVIQPKVTIDALANVSVDLSLNVGSASTEVTVNATSDTIQTENTTLGSTMRNEVYAALPLAMSQGVPRDPTSFISLAPGVAAVTLQSAGPSYTSFNGGQQETNGLYFEGLPITFPNQQGDTRPLALGVSVDAVNQFQVEINGEKAQYQGQGFHNYVIKSGANQFHGSIFEFFRNTALDARGYYATFVPRDHQNEFGGNIGGPIIKNKLFFFGNIDAYIFNTTTAPFLLSIPSLKERQGDFSELLALPTPVQIHDPATGNPFPGNIIPKSQLSPIALSLQSYLPDPNVAGATVQNNYVNPLPRSITNKNTTERVDYNISQNNLLYGVFAYGTWRTDYTGNITPTGTALPLPYTQTPGIVIERPLIVQVHDTWTISPSLLNTFGIGGTRLSIPILPVTQAGDYPTKAGLSGLPGNGQAAHGFPQISFSGPNIPNNWSSAGPFNEWENHYVVEDSIDWVHGNHVFKFGGTYQISQDNRANPTDGTNASFTFTNLETGNAYASYLLGAVNAATVNNNNVVETGSRFSNYSLYAQDDWKVTPKMTVNLGLRWDVYNPFGEQHNRYSIMDPTLPNPGASGRLGALVYGKQLVNTHYKNFQPRIGITYSPDSKTVFRGGFLVTDTVGTLALGGNGPNGPGQTGFNPLSTVNAPVGGQPAFYWQNGVSTPVTPFPLQSAGFGVGNTTTNPTGAINPQVIRPDLAGKSPQYFNWSAGFQRELPGTITFGLTYSGSVGHFLPRANALGMYTNSMPEKYLAIDQDRFAKHLPTILGSPVTPGNIAIAQSYFPEIALPFPNYQGTLANMLTPFPQYASPGVAGTGTGGISCYSCDTGNSSYHSMQVSVSRNLSHGVTTQFAYTWSKEIDNLTGTSQLAVTSTALTRNPFHPEWDRGLGLIDHRHNLHWTGVWNLPFGKDHYFGSNRIVSTIIGGWSLSGIYSLSTGNPLTIIGSNCKTPGIVSTCIIDLNPNFTGSAMTAKIGSSLDRRFAYINKAAFQEPVNFTFGNAPRSAPYGLTTPTNWNVDATLRRAIQIRGSLKAEISGDFFNLLNNVIFAAPATNIDSSNFGTVSATQNLPRRIQVSARVSF